MRITFLMSYSEGQLFDDCNMRNISTTCNELQVLYCPSDSSLLSVVGNGFAKSFKLSEISFRQIATDFTKHEGHRFPWHVWLSQPGDRDDKDRENRDPCIYACDNGELMYAEGGEIISSIPADHSEGFCYAEMIMLFSKGFICGEIGGKISIFEKVDEKEAKEGYKRTCSFLVDAGGATINSMAMTPNEDLLACILGSNQLVTVPFQHRDVYKPDEVPRELIVQVYHSASITGLDVCLRKPILVTCSIDRSVRVWNYVERSCDLIKFFPEEIFSISLHPSGFHVLVGFSDRLRFMNLLIDDIRACKELGIKGCQECKFSNGGQYFAAVHVNVVQIFSTYTCENIGNLRGHNGKVRCIWWSADDTVLLTAGLDGAIYEWRMKDFKRSRENVIKGCLYTSVTGVTGSNSLFAVGSDKKLKEMDENQVIKSYPSVVVIAQIVLPSMSRLLFAATELGGVRTYRYPLTGEYQEAQASGAPITRMCTSSDDSLLFCTGEDGVLSIFDIKDKEKAIASGSLRREKEALGWAEEVLMTKMDLEEMCSHSQELEEKVKELATDNEYQMRLKDLAMNERIKALNEAFQHQIEESHLKYDKMLQQKNQEILDLEEKQIKAEEKHLQQLKDLEEQWRQKMMAEVERYEGKLVQEKDIVLRLKGENGLLKKKFNEFLKDMEEQKAEIRKLFEQKKELYEMLACFERDAKAHNGNTRKELVIAEMNLKLEGSQKEVIQLCSLNYDANATIKHFQHDFYELTQLVQEPQALKEAVKTLNEKYVSNKVTMVPVDQELLKEISRQRDYLERMVEGLQRKFCKDNEANHKNHLRIMRENVVLIKELNELRRDLKVMKLNAHKGRQKKLDSLEKVAVTTRSSDIAATSEFKNMRAQLQELEIKLKTQQEKITLLESLLTENQNAELYSKLAGELPCMDNSLSTEDVVGSNANVLNLQMLIKQPLNSEIKQEHDLLERLAHSDEKDKPERIQLNITVVDAFKNVVTEDLQFRITQLEGALADNLKQIEYLEKALQEQELDIKSKVEADASDEVPS
ncbi:hypothetical protein O6H91_04G062500 [Diphasiastrum complanatum]|uniref:Uncharacterized protein n=1 Tax=Diphasiastrum complanatum TaxID=34168 RepID=A0ACC2DY66_DIPCM|nr:hypothetical protein O6H91_04G062500 [Diphasiastrum complanatum]